MFEFFLRVEIEIFFNIIKTKSTILGIILLNKLLNSIKSKIIL